MEGNLEKIAELLTGKGSEAVEMVYKLNLQAVQADFLPCLIACAFFTGLVILLTFFVVKYFRTKARKGDFDMGDPETFFQVIVWAAFILVFTLLCMIGAGDVYGLKAKPEAIAMERTLKQLRGK